MRRAPWMEMWRRVAKAETVPVLGAGVANEVAGFGVAGVCADLGVEESGVSGPCPSAVAVAGELGTSQPRAVQRESQVGTGFRFWRRESWAG